VFIVVCFYSCKNLNALNLYAKHNLILRHASMLKYNYFKEFQT